ncbi:MAG: DUF6263 family protein [Planctomycetaceae bacterium]
MLTHRMLMLLALGFSTAPTQAADKFTLRDDPSSGETWQVIVEVTGKGDFEFQPPDEKQKPVTHPVELAASFRFLERRLPPAGRDEAAFRGLRHFEEARSQIQVGGQSSAPNLREERSQIVARATRAGIVSYSPAGPLTSMEVELLPFPGDPLVLAALLPDREVSVGETWTPDAWAGPAMAGTEVSLNQKTTCRLDSVRDGQATVSFTAQIDGATKGATSKTTLEGTLTFDVNADAVVAAKVTQTEKRSIGPLSPGMELTLTAVVERARAASDEELSDAAVKAIPLEPEASDLWIEYTAPFGVGLAGERGWRVFHQTDKLLILRLLDHGGLIAQCNLAPAPTVPAGQRTPGRLLEDAVRKSLGEQFTEIVDTEELDMGGDASVYRVTVSGKTKDAKRLWRYYLVTAPDGRQAELVFTLEPDHLARLADRDLELVSSLQFLSRPEPTPAGSEK